MSVTKPGMSSSTRGKHDHGAVRQLAAGIAPGVEFGADAVQDAKTLDAQQQSSRPRRTGSPAPMVHSTPILLPTTTNTGDLDERQRQDEQQDEGQRVMPSRGTFMKAVAGLPAIGIGRYWRL